MSHGRILIAASFFALQTHAYTITSTDSGEPVRLRYGQKLMLAGNPNNQDGFPSGNFRSGVIQGLHQWRGATGGFLDFDYWQGTDPAIYPPEASSDGLSSVFFASNSRSSVDPNVIGYTQVWFNSATGDLVESDIILNDRNYTFSSNPADSSSNPRALRPAVHLDAILSHEIGHAIGLGHSGDLNSSMLFVEYLDQAHLGCDDLAGARHLYGSTSPTGALSGVVLNPSKNPVSGVQIIAISRKTGLPLARVVSDRNGRFVFGALEPGDVGLALEPYPGPPDSIGPAHLPANQDFCGTRSFPIQFVTEADSHTFREFTVTPRRFSDTGSITLHCRNIPASGGTSGDEIAPPFFVDAGSVARPVAYSFIANGPFTATGLTHLLLSPIRVNLEAFDEKGRRIQVQTKYPLYSSDSGFKIAETRIEGSAFGRITIRATPLFPSDAPLPFRTLSLKDQAFFVVSFQNGTFPLNPRCLPEDSPPEYFSPPGNPVRYSSTKSAREDFGFCGVPAARAGEVRSSRATPSSLAGRLLGWFWPFFVIAAFQLNSIRRRIRLKPTCRSDS